MPVNINLSQLTLIDALDLAILIEEEAVQRYEEFYEQIGDRYEGDAADFFRMMAANEVKHRDQLKQKRSALFKDKPSNVSLDMVWDVEAPSEGSVRTYMSPVEAAEVALEGETKAWNFFNDALVAMKDPEVRELFLELRDEEAEHQTALKNLLKKMNLAKGRDIEDDEADEPPAL